MSYNIYVVKQPVPEDDRDAWPYVFSVLERREDESGLPPHRLFLALIERLTARYPCLCDVEDETETIWLDGPLRNNAGYSVTVLAMDASRSQESMPFVVEAANELGLVVCDEQLGQIFRPPKPSVRYPQRLAENVFRVEITGFREGYSQREVASALAPLFKCSEKDALRLLERDKPVVKTGVSGAQAEKYVTALEHCGCTCALVTEGFQVAAVDPMTQCRRLAEAGDLQAQYDYGWYCHEANAEEASAWWHKAAEQGYAEAQVRLASFYHAGGGASADFQQSVFWARKAAERGLAQGQYFLGFLYEYGDGLEKNEALAIEWYRKAAEQEHVEAQFRLGVLFELSGASEGEAQMLWWYRLAAAQNHRLAQHNLGCMYSAGKGGAVDVARAYRWFRRAAEQGHGDAQCIVGDMLSEGRGVGKDVKAAAEWYRKSAEQGVAGGQYNLACSYADGDGVPLDEAEAFRWFEKGAEQGHMHSLAVLGGWYLSGRYVGQDYGRAAELLLKAAHQGHSRSQRLAGFLYDKGWGVAQDPSEALSWLLRAAEQGDVKAQYYLGEKYLLGRGVPKNPVKAIDWYKMAAAQGDEDAQAMLDELMAEFEPGAQQENKRKGWKFWK